MRNLRYRFYNWLSIVVFTFREGHLVRLQQYLDRKTCESAPVEEFE